MAQSLLNLGRMAKTILVIEDDPAVLESYRRLLRRLGQSVRLLGDPNEARRDPGVLDGVDLLLLDQRMPGLTGLELLALMLERRPPGAAPPAVILISALPSEELRRRARSLGVVEVIEKPVDPERLIDTIRSALTGGAASGEPKSGVARP